MSGRNRGRGNPNQDADEERRLWKEIKDKSKEVDGMVVSSYLLLFLFTCLQTYLSIFGGVSHYTVKRSDSSPTTPRKIRTGVTGCPVHILTPRVVQGISNLFDFVDTTYKRSGSYGNLH